MSLPKSQNTKDNEQNKFINDSDNCVAVNTVAELKEGSFNDVTADEPTVYNVTMTTANTEYSVSLPEGTNRFKLKIRDNEAKYEVGYVSVGNTFSVPRGNTYEETGLDFSIARTIYFKANKGNLVMEIVAWK